MTLGRSGVQRRRGDGSLCSATGGGAQKRGTVAGGLRTGHAGGRSILFPAAALQADGSAASMVVEVQGAWSGKEGQGSGVALYRAREEGEGPAQGERRRGRARVRH